MKSLLIDENKRWAYKGHHEAIAKIKAKAANNPKIQALQAAIERGKELVK